MKKRTNVVIAFISIIVITLVIFCNYSNKGKFAKECTEIVTVQSDTLNDTLRVELPVMNGDFVSEEWLRERLKHHGVDNQEHIDKFIIIAKRESSLIPTVVNRTLNRNKTIDSGLFQINSCHKNLYAKYNLLDPEENLLAALELYRIAGFKPWKSSIGNNTM